MSEKSGVTPDFSQTQELFGTRSDIRVHMKVSEYRDVDQDGIRVKGNFYIDFLKAPHRDVKVLTLKASSNSSSGLAHLQLPKELMREIGQRAFAGESWG